MEEKGSAGQHAPAAGEMYGEAGQGNVMHSGREIKENQNGSKPSRPVRTTEQRETDTAEWEGVG